MVHKYRDFQLQLELDQNALKIDIAGSPVGINLADAISVPLDMKSKMKMLNRFPDSNEGEYGRSLFELVFQKDVLEQFRLYKPQASSDEGIRVCIRTNPDTLSHAAWEILCEQAQSFLALDPGTPVVRTPRVGGQVPSTTIQKPVRMLVFLASPRLTEKINAAHERQVFDEALREPRQNQEIVVDFLGFDSPQQATFESLKDQLSQPHVRYDIVHIICHGDLEIGEDGQIILADPDTGKKDRVSARDLALLFRSRKVLLTTLQSCHTGGLGTRVPATSTKVSGGSGSSGSRVSCLQQPIGLDRDEDKDHVLMPSGVAELLVRQGMPAVLAMQKEIDQDVATYFMKRLYERWLAVGCRFEDALTQARQSVKHKFSDRIAPWAVPVLFVRQGIHLVVQEPNERPPDPAVKLLDAAIPGDTRVGKETHLVTRVRSSDQPSLRETLGADRREDDIHARDVKTTPGFIVSFPRDETTGKRLPGTLRLDLETKDFGIDEKYISTTMPVPLESDSQTFYLPIMPKREGRAKIRLHVFDETTGVEIMNQELSTNARTGGSFTASYVTVDGEQQESLPDRRSDGERPGDSEELKAAEKAMEAIGPMKGKSDYYLSGPSGAKRTGVDSLRRYRKFIQRKVLPKIVLQIPERNTEWLTKSLATNQAIVTALKRKKAYDLARHLDVLSKKMADLAKEEENSPDHFASQSKLSVEMSRLMRHVRQEIGDKTLDAIARGSLWDRQTELKCSSTEFRRWNARSQKILSECEEHLSQMAEQPERDELAKNLEFAKTIHKTLFPDRHVRQRQRRKIQQQRQPKTFQKRRQPKTFQKRRQPRTIQTFSFRKQHLERVEDLLERLE